MHLLTRTLRLGMVGKDVEAGKRAVARRLGGDRLATLTSRPTVVRRTFGPFFVKDVKAAARSFRLDEYGVIGPELEDELWTKGCFDLYAIKLAEQYAAGVKPKLVEPRQGFNSLHKSLWEAYSIGRNAGLSDLGTYNPASTLPSGGKADHAYYPSYAFDLGIDPDTGYQNPTARKVFDLLCRLPEVEYVILGDKIWSRSRGLHAYTYGGHLNHLHCSGVH